ncbi:MAG: hypothetical protein H0T42_21170 [Deltaproteobacteria bacterium]|nr:hypothetical protein [Deltaproteobacteria bacterium]
MRSALVAAALLASTPVAADRNIPASWTPDLAANADLSRKAETARYGGLPPSLVAVTAYTVPTGGSLYVTWTVVKATVAERGPVANDMLLDIRESAARQSGAQIESSEQHVDSAAKHLESSITWSDPATGLRQHARTVVVADGERVMAKTGECIFPITAPADVTKVCKTVLAALDPDIQPSDRLALAIVAADHPVAADDAASAPTPTGPSRMTEQPRLDDGGRTGMAPMTISPAKREIDRRPLFLGGGIVLLAAVFWWNRRRRDRFDREEDGSPPAVTEPEPSSGDDDADDLQAAARGPAPKDEP